MYMHPFTRFPNRLWLQGFWRITAGGRGFAGRRSSAHAKSMSVAAAGCLKRKTAFEWEGHSRNKSFKNHCIFRFSAPRRPRRAALWIPPRILRLDSSPGFLFIWIPLLDSSLNSYRGLLSGFLSRIALLDSSSGSLLGVLSGFLFGLPGLGIPLPDSSLGSSPGFFLGFSMDSSPALLSGFLSRIPLQKISPG